MLELDHVFVCVSEELNIVNTLTDFGLNLSARQIHQGQGTANRCAFFNNAYLELLLHNNNQELQSRAVQAISLGERMQWKKTKASPFGVAFRFEKDTEQNIPMKTWSYDAPFLPDGVTIPIITPLNSIQEPLLFLSLMTKPPIERKSVHCSALEHRGNKRLLTQVKITTSSDQKLSKQLQWFCDRDLVSIAQGAEHHAELEWDNGKERQIFDFRPILPLSIRY